tara:strand:- start:19100 stop:19852 length:753 start_codon:yes stop_codon:yes gene_type:complete
MQFGLCPLSIVPVRALPEESSELISQLLYGDHFKIIETRKFYSKIRVANDACEGWISNLQWQSISEETYRSIANETSHSISSDLVSFVSTKFNELIPVLLGSTVSCADLIQHQFEGHCLTEKIAKSKLISIASLYLNSPFLSGGKTPFGIDGAGFTQMVYKASGHHLLRTATKQATQGEPLSFIEECEPGDLAFFDNADGIIDHVGMVMENNYVIHAHGKVKIDRIDHTGIFNTETKLYTHKLRVLKKIF